MLYTTNEKSEALALIIDGKSLTYALQDDVKEMFLDLAIGCASVICCRSSPKQKALVSFECIFPQFLLACYKKEKKRKKKECFSLIEARFRSQDWLRLEPVTQLWRSETELTMLECSKKLTLVLVSAALKECR